MVAVAALADGTFATFDDCVDANTAVPPVDFDFDGGPLGLWLSDYPYDDNTPGVNGRNPALVVVVGCLGCSSSGGVAASDAAAPTFSMALEGAPGAEKFMCQLVTFPQGGYVTSQSHDYRSSRRDSEHRIVVHVDSDGQRRILGDGVG